MKLFIILILVFSFNLLANNKLDLQVLLNRFNYESNFYLSKLEKKNSTKNYISYKGQLETDIFKTKSPYKIRFRYYKTKIKKRAPLIIVYPSIMGVSSIEYEIAIFLAKNGINSVIVPLPENILSTKRHTSDLDPFLIRITNSVQLVIDYLITRPEIQKEFIGSIGSSLGGIRSILAAEIDQRIKAIVTFTAGGDIPEILTNSKQFIIKRYRKKRMKIENILSEHDFLNKLRKTSKLDPITFASLRADDDFFMYISVKDTDIPTRNQIKLWKSLGLPNCKFIKMSHVPTVISSVYYQKKVLNFIKKRWEFNNH